MKKALAILIALLLYVSLPGCSLLSKPHPTEASASPSLSAVVTQTTALTPMPEASPAATTDSPTPTPVLKPTPSPTPATAATLIFKPTPTPFAADAPDKAGEKGVQFDIYKSKVTADLNTDGNPEQIEFAAGKTSATLAINGKKFTIKKSGLAQLIAITDINQKDKILEMY